MAMRRTFLAFLGLGLASLGLLAGCAGAGRVAGQAEASAPRVLVLTISSGYRHASIEFAAGAIAALGVEAGYVMKVSADANVLRDLGGFDALVLVSTSSDAAAPEQDWIVGARRQGLMDFVHGGGGVVAVHAAAASHYSWPWYGEMIGAVFDGHPEGTPIGVARVVDGDHPAARGLPPVQTRSDEWYYFRRLNPNVRVLVEHDPGPNGEGGVRPLSWAHEFEGGRVFYTAMGHSAENYQEAYLMRHIGGGLRWVLRREM
jgi:type 1 glutamine amidotransferase